MRYVIAGTVAALVGLASTVQAATLVGVSGQVLINRGSGFELAQPGLELKPGDIVVANPGSMAHIAYPEGCMTQVIPGVIASVAAKAPCAPVTTGALPLVAAPLLSAGALTAGGAAAGGGALAYALTKKSSDTTPATTTSSTPDNSGQPPIDLNNGPLPGSP